MARRPSTAWAEEEEEERPLTVVFASPAEYFTDAAPIGNGSLGGMVWGDVATDKLQLNHDTLWTGAPGSYTDPDAPAALAAQQAYGSYKRELDLHTATVRITYGVGPVQYTREHFCSNPHQVIVTRIAASETGHVSCKLSLSSQLKNTVTVTNANEVVMEGVCPGQRPPAGLLRSSRNSSSSSDDDVTTGGIKFAAVLGVQMDSTLDPTSAAVATLNRARSLTYEQLKAAHLDDYQRLFHRVTLRLSPPGGGLEDAHGGLMRTGGKEMLKRGIGDDEGIIRTSADRVKSFATDEDPWVCLGLKYPICKESGAKMLQQHGTPHLNINLQMNYWPTLPCNLSECQEPLFDFLQSLAVNGSKTAKVNYQARGWVTHHVSDVWAKSSAFIKKPKHAVWPMGGAWLCTHLWEHYQFSLDKDFLEYTAYPLLEGCATFLVDCLIEGPGGYLQTNPSTSPEHAFTAPDGKPASVSYSTTMDISIIREVFSAVLLSAEILEKSDTDLVEKIKKVLPRLPPIHIARDNTIMEWALDFQDPEVHHRHLSHLFGLYPGHTITMDNNPDVCGAVSNSLYKRGEDGPGWSTTWKMALWARLMNSENAYRMVLKFTAAISEMLVQSTQNDLYLLPALPRDKWPRGCAKGLRARGDVTVNICWDEGELQEAMLWSKNQNSVTKLHYGGCVTSVRVCRGTVYKFNRGLQCLEAWPAWQITFTIYRQSVQTELIANTYMCFLYLIKLRE
ncbi:unnamed protein product [Miscanthus lutarioriparius]|uniref:Glycosyl hydrolase family 95 N-terminal domain-containing protein n=1 Tax=Miscanthus lutarioriparius TaxID=422564 RepID=A0A811NFG3_9POAL|nr:unnamed protein product [Miscanthus lutarioriparius]